MPATPDPLFPLLLQRELNPRGPSALEEESVACYDPVNWRTRKAIEYLSSVDHPAATWLVRKPPAGLPKPASDILDSGPDYCGTRFFHLWHPSGQMKLLKRCGVCPTCQEKASVYLFARIHRAIASLDDPLAPIYVQRLEIGEPCDARRRLANLKGDAFGIIRLAMPDHEDLSREVWRDPEPQALFFSLDPLRKRSKGSPPLYSPDGRGGSAELSQEEFLRQAWHVLALPFELARPPGRIRNSSILKLSPRFMAEMLAKEKQDYTLACNLSRKIDAGEHIQNAVEAMFEERPDLDPMSGYHLNKKWTDKDLWPYLWPILESAADDLEGNGFLFEAEQIRRATRAKNNFPAP